MALFYTLTRWFVLDHFSDNIGASVSGMFSQGMVGVLSSSPIRINRYHCILADILSLSLVDKRGSFIPLIKI